MPFIPSSVAAGSGGGITAAQLWAVNPGDKPADSPSSYDDEFDGASLDPKWGWINQGAATFAQAGNGYGLFTGASAYGTLRALTQTYSGSQTFDFRCKFSAQHYLQATAWHHGLILGNSSSGKYLTLVRYTDDTKSSVFLAYWADKDNINTYDIQPGNVWTDTPYFRVSCDGTTMTFYFSLDGIAWTSIGTQALVTRIASVDRIGFGMTASGAYPGTISWFRSI